MIRNKKEIDGSSESEFQELRGRMLKETTKRHQKEYREDSRKRKTGREMENLYFRWKDSRSRRTFCRSMHLSVFFYSYGSSHARFAEANVRVSDRRRRSISRRMLVAARAEGN